MSGRDEQIVKLYHAALRQLPSERAAFIAKQAPADVELRREVEALLAQQPGTAIRVGPSDEGIGELVGVYRIDSMLGYGGMGVVYRATDTQLKRPAAIKFLAGELASAEARQRFQREAQMASALNHPNILTVYGFGEHDGRQYIATELVDGGTLDDWARERLRSDSGSDLSPPWRRVVDLLGGVADGIATAHDANILHRDIKPANILISKAGHAKLADFGLAKLAERAPSDAGLTKTGAIVGTIDYMSPEQVAGRTLDARSDIFSFGVVLYELLAGRRPFGGTSDYERLKAVVDSEPPALRDDVPEALRSIVDKALEKNPADRYQSMRELVVDLRRIARRTSSVSGERTGLSITTARSRTSSALVRFGALGLLLAAGVTGAWWAYRTWTAAPVGLGTFAGATPVTSYPGVEFSPSFSPDGDRVVFSWNGGEGVALDLYVAQIGTPTPQLLVEHAAGNSAPHWSPDGRQIAFFRSSAADSGELIVVPAVGGQERKLREIDFSGPALNQRSVLAWTPDSQHIVFSSQSAESDVHRLHWLSLATGETREIPLGIDGGLGDMSPSISPDGRWLAFTRFSSGPRVGELMAQRLADGDTVTPVGEPTSITGVSVSPKAIGWTPDSRALVYFDGPSFKEWVAGPERDVRTVYTATGVIEDATLAWKDGRARIVASMLNVHTSLWTVGLDPAMRVPTGGPERRASSTQGESYPALSPDGRRLAFASARTGAGELWITDGEGQNARQLTRLAAFVVGMPRWDREGKRIVFHARIDGQLDGKAQLLVVEPDGVDVPTSVAPTAPSLVAGTWSADGQYVYAAAVDTGSRNRVVRVRVADGSLEALPFEGEGAEETADGKRLLYAKSGEPGIFARSLEGDVRNNAEARLVEDYATGEGGWSAVATGIYYTAVEGGRSRAIRFFDYATGRSTDVMPTPFRVGGGLSVSQDETRLWYTGFGADAGSDLMLLEFEPARE